MAEESSRDTFERYLRLRYSDTTTKLYSWAYNRYGIELRTQEDVDDFLIEKVYGEKGNPFYMGFLRSYFDCFRINLNIVRDKRKRPKKQHKDYKFLTKQEIDTIIEKTPFKISMLVRLFFETGLRLRELINLPLNGIDLTNKYFSGVGKNDKPFKVKFSDTSKEELTKYLFNNQLEYPFHFDESNKDHAKYFWRHLKKECEKIGIENVRPHRIRHALGHHLRADKDFDLQQIKEVLRHSRLETTDIYTTATKEEIEKRMDEEVFEDGQNKDL